MPEGTKREQVRELIFAEHPEGLPPAVPWIGLGDYAAAGTADLRLASVIHPHALELRAEFIEWFGAINAANASPQWWAHTTSAKNLLSSPFGNQALELLALRRALDSTPQARVGVVGATTAQREVITRFAQSEPGLRVAAGGVRRRDPLFVPVRLAYQFLRIFGAWLLWLRAMRASSNAHVHLVSYADAAFRDGNDAFFGPLAHMLGKARTPLTCLHHVFIHGPYRPVVRKLRDATGLRYAPLFAELHAVDIVSAIAASWRALRCVGRWPRPGLIRGLDLQPVLREALYWDLAKGGYFHNVLVRAAARRLAARHRPPVLFYPFENKSLEKLLLIGVREGAPQTSLVGFQHTAVTPRHTTLLFGQGEAERTPLPDRIFTLGSVSRDYLETHGNYPPGLLETGFALRQAQRAPLERRTPSKAVHVLFALSSSLAELTGASRCVLASAALRPGWTFAVRPHPEFPLSRLAAPAREALGKCARDLAGTSLDDNLAWCDVVVYASSTVAIEAMMAARPVVNLDVGDLLPVDPVTEPLALHRTARTPEELVAMIEGVCSLEEPQLSSALDEARRFVERYFVAPTPERLDRLLGWHLQRDKRGAA